MEKYNIKFNEYEPKYVQIAENIKKLINSRVIKDGDKLPPIRELSKSLKVNNVTIVSCYNKLVAEGYAYQKMGSGTFAKKREIVDYFKKEYSKEIKLIKNNCESNVIDFTGESSKIVDFPIDEFKKVINEVLDRDGAEALIKQEAFGYYNLRSTINKVFWENSLNIEDLLIVSGAQQGIDIASKAILNINDNVIVEKPTYAGALSVFKFRRANVFEIPIDEDGIYIIYDDYHAGKTIGEYIGKKGHQKVGYIGVYETDQAVGIERRNGVLDGLKEYGITPVTGKSDYSFIGGQMVTRELLEKESDLDAIICATDRLAFGAYKILHEHKKRIPEEVSVAAFGGYDESTLLTPELTTLKFDSYGMGYLGAETILKMITGEPVSKKQIVGYEFIEGGSVRS